MTDNRQPRASKDDERDYLYQDLRESGLTHVEAMRALDQYLREVE